MRGIAPQAQREEEWRRWTGPSSSRLCRPLVGGLVILVTLIVLLGTAVRDPRPHDIAVGMVAPQPVADQLAQGFAQNAPGAFKFTTYATDADARTAVDQRDVVAALIVGQTGPTLVVAGAAGEAIAGGVTAAFTTYSPPRARL